MIVCQCGGVPPTREHGVPLNMYLVIMLAVIGIITIVAVPSLFTKRCRSCGRRNGLDRTLCKHCGTAFQDDVDS